MLFDAIEKVRDGEMETRQATAIANMADRIIKSAEIEIQFALTCSKLDKENQGISPGPLLLTSNIDK